MKNKNKLKLQNVVIFGAITTSLVVLLTGFSSPKVRSHEIDIVGIQNYFLNGHYDQDMKDGKITHGSVREHLNKSHELLEHKTLPQVLVQ